MIETLIPHAVTDVNTTKTEFTATVQAGYLIEDYGSQSSIGGYGDLSRQLSQNWSMALRFFSAVSVDELNSDAIHFSNYLNDPTGQSYGLLNMGYLAFKASDFSAQIGRILLNTPFADPDDFRMALNTFEGFWGRYDIADTLSMQLLGVHKMSGIDARSIERFLPLSAKSAGMVGVGLGMKQKQHHLDLWAYHVDAVMDTYYSRYRFHSAVGSRWDVSATAAVTYQQQRDASGYGGLVFSGDLTAEQEGCRLFAAYDRLEVEQTSISDGYGAGPFMSAADLTSLGVISALYPGHDMSAYKIQIGKSFAPDISLEYGLSYFDLASVPLELYEQNLIVQWRIEPDLHLHMVATNGDHGERPMNLLFMRLRYHYD